MTKLEVRHPPEMSVVPTDCPPGPLEILEVSPWGPLVLVGHRDSQAESMAAAIEDQTPGDLAARAAEFIVDRAEDSYSRVMLLAKYQL